VSLSPSRWAGGGPPACSSTRKRTSWGWKLCTVLVAFSTAAGRPGAREARASARARPPRGSGAGRSCRRRRRSDLRRSSSPGPARSFAARPPRRARTRPRSPPARRPRAGSGLTAPAPRVGRRPWRSVRIPVRRRIRCCKHAPPEAFSSRRRTRSSLTSRWGSWVPLTRISLPSRPVGLIGPLEKSSEPSSLSFLSWIISGMSSAP
jgi:hypothetical protein